MARDPYHETLNHYGGFENAPLIEIGRDLADPEWVLYPEYTDRALMQEFPDDYDSRLINFSYINSTGIVPGVTRWEGRTGVFYQDDPSSQHFGSLRIDWNADDTFNDAYNGILERVIERVENSPSMYQLRTMEAWGPLERIAWESELAEIISEEVNAVPGLDTYRNASDKIAYPDTSLRAQWINAVSEDIENNTVRVEFDCEVQSIIEGSLMHKVDEHFLPERTQEISDASNLKVQSNYFYAVGEVLFNAEDTSSSAHAFIVSSATGNIIEATRDPDNSNKSPYRISADPDWNFEKLARGEVFEDSRGAAYGGDLSETLEVRITETIDHSEKPKDDTEHTLNESSIIDTVINPL